MLVAAHSVTGDDAWPDDTEEECVEKECHEEVYDVGGNREVLQAGDGLAGPAALNCDVKTVDRQRFDCAGVFLPLAVVEPCLEHLVAVGVEEDIAHVAGGWQHNSMTCFDVTVEGGDDGEDGAELPPHPFTVGGGDEGVGVALLVAVDVGGDDAKVWLTTEYFEVEGIVLKERIFEANMVPLKEGATVELGPDIIGEPVAIEGFGSVTIKGKGTFGLGLGVDQRATVGVNMSIVEL